MSYTDEIPEREIKALSELKSGFKKLKKLIILTKNIEKVENEIKFIPLWEWLLNN